MLSKYYRTRNAVRENCCNVTNCTLKISAFYQREKIEKQVQEILLEQYIHQSNHKLLRNIAGFVSCFNFLSEKKEGKLAYGNLTRHSNKGKNV